jgi:hypothetical protein
MKNQNLISALFAFLLVITTCDNSSRKNLHTHPKSESIMVTEETLKQILAAFNHHDLDAIMEYFSDDCTFDFPRGPEYYG